MSRSLAGKVVVAFLGAGLCAAVTGCSLDLPGVWTGEKQGEPQDEPAEGPQVGSAAPAAAAVAAVDPGVIEERPIQVPETPAEAARPEAAAGDYRVISSFSDLGVVEIVLEGTGVAAAAWRSADAEAGKRCRAWGYERAMGNAPVETVRLYRCEGKVAAAGVGRRGQAMAALWRTGEFRQVLWNFRGRAEQGDRQALAMVRGMAAHRGDLERLAESGDAKAWTHWMFSELMATQGEVRGEIWQCFAAGGDGSGMPDVMLGRLEEAGAPLGVGEVSTSGASHPAVFRASGPALRWEYGSGPWRELPHAFVIEPDGAGYQIDVSGSENVQAGSRRAFDCQVMH